jgi:ketosteroid isomerase-like protein
LSIAGAIALWASSPPRAPGEESGRIVEIRSYNLKPGARDRFHTRFVAEALPLLERWNVDVVSYGPSLHDEDSYYLIRAFAGIEERRRSEDAFYGSDEWREGPREATLADIESYATTVVRMDEATLLDLRRMGRHDSAPEGNVMTANAASNSDLATLLELNRDYIRSVENSDVRRFEEILADDFLCSLPDGTLVDRRGFLEQTARPVQIANLEAHDVNVRLMGDFAIVHARTTYTAADGSTGSGRYTDVWARRNGRWLAVSAHVTRR